MSRHREFKAARREHAGEPLTLDFEGVSGTVYSFTIPFIPAGPMLDMVAAMAGGGLESVAQFGQFLTQVVPEDQHETLRLALRDMEMGDASGFATGLIEESVAGPLGGPSDSSPGPSTNGTESSLEPVVWTPSG